MTLLHPERERPEPRKRAGQFALMARGPIFPVLRRWIPDNWRERALGSFWLREVLAWAFCVAVGFLLALAFAWRPWE